LSFVFIFLFLFSLSIVSAVTQAISYDFYAQNNDKRYGRGDYKANGCLCRPTDFRAGQKVLKYDQRSNKNRDRQQKSNQYARYYGRAFGLAEPAVYFTATGPAAAILTKSLIAHIFSAYNEKKPYN
jgi:hypothetical protein